MNKIRIDEYLVKFKNVESREKAKRIILSGYVYTENQLIDKPGKLIDISKDNIFIKDYDQKYVSRGGLKIEKAFSEFNISPKNKICLDVGSSTGGFTDYLLKNGASKVYSTDVGKNQLHSSLINNNKVIAKENINFRYADHKEFDNKLFDIIVCDISFISLSKILKNIQLFLNDDGIFVCLLKPQFEAGKGVTKKGVINDKDAHLLVINNFVKQAEEYKLFLNKITFSPIRGQKKKNIEFLCLLSKQKSSKYIDYMKIVNESREYFGIK